MSTSKIRGINESCFLKQLGCQRRDGGMFTKRRGDAILEQIINFVKKFQFKLLRTSLE